MMAGQKPALYTAGVTCLGFICFALAATAVGLPEWAKFETHAEYSGYRDVDSGYFGPWRVCKRLHYNREKCGDEAAGFRPSAVVYISGLVACGSCVCLALFNILCVIQIAMISSRDKVVMKYSALVVIKLVLALLSGKLKI